MNDDIILFFSRATHCKPEVLRRIVADIDTLTNSLRLSRRITTWGTTEQPKICIYGGLPLTFSQDPANSSSNPIGSSNTTEAKYVLPIQIWITHQYPIDPPNIYLVCTDICDSGANTGTQSNAVVKIVGNHPNVDLTGLCFCAELADWRPATSSLCITVERLGRAMERSGICPLYMDENVNTEPSSGISPSFPEVEGDVGEGNECIICVGKKDTVLVPCGHYCLCMACASNVLECPVCRAKIKVRQRIFY